MSDFRGHWESGARLEDAGGVIAVDGVWLTERAAQCVEAHGLHIPSMVRALYRREHTEETLVASVLEDAPADMVPWLREAVWSCAVEAENVRREVAARQEVTL